MTFYIVSAVMIAAALLAVVLPLLKSRDVEADTTSTDKNITSTDKSNTASRRGRLIAVLAVVILIPLGAVLLYRTFGRPHWQEEIAATQPQDMRQVQGTVEKLEQRLRDKPNDAEGWELLGRSYVVLEKIPEAVAAYEKALAQSGGSDPQSKNAQIKLGLGEALAIQDEKSLSGRAGDLFDAALTQLPDNPKALWYGAISSLSRGNLLQGRDRLQHMLALNPPQNIRSILERQIQDITQQLASAGKQPSSVSATAAAENANANEHASATSSAHVLQVAVSLAPALAKKIDKAGTLFVLARAPNAGGPPLAAVRRRAGDLPLSITLSEQNAMIRDHGIDSVNTVQVVARISKSGMPQSQSGDLYGEANYTFSSSAKDTAHKATVTIVIDRAVP